DVGGPATNRFCEILECQTSLGTQSGDLTAESLGWFLHLASSENSLGCRLPTGVSSVRLDRMAVTASARRAHTTAAYAGPAFEGACSAAAEAGHRAEIAPGNPLRAT